MMKEIPEMFGSLVFGDTAMRQRLPKETYKALNRTIAQGRSLDPSAPTWAGPVGSQCGGQCHEGLGN